MSSTHHSRSRLAVLVLSLSLAWGAPARAQMTGGPGLSSGSGAGTGAGGRTGVLRNQSGSLSGVGPGPAAGGVLRGRPIGPPPGRGSIGSFGPGADVTFPNDPYLIPFMTMELPGMPVDSKVPTHVTADLLASARLIKTPEERSLALQRIANGAMTGKQFALAHKTLEEAITATSDVKVPLVRDQRLIAIVTSLTTLTDELLRTGRENLSSEAIPAEKDADGPEALPKALDNPTLIRMARLEWQRAVYLATIVGNPTYRNEMLYKVVESEANGSALIANELVKPTEESLSDRPAPGAGPERGKPPTLEERVRARLAMNETFKKLADEILVDAFKHAKTIDRLIWKYRAKVRIAILAADSQQYKRGIELSRGIDNGESRTEAMLLLAEAMCRKNQKELDELATVTYQEAARGAASIRQEGLRGVLAGFLIDSLIMTGRFEDARACVTIYPEQAQRLVALGAVAEAQGRRGGSESAREWIAKEVPEEYRPTLYRRVTTGVLWAIGENRGKELSRPEMVPIP
jgi:hypothetical protein